MTPLPEIRYAQAADGIGIAYAVAGSGYPLVYAPRLQSCIEREWRDDAEARPHLERLAAHHSVVQFDKRGFGFSDRSRVDITMETLLLDLGAVVDHLGLDDFALFAVSQAGPVAIRYAARNPDRVSHLILHGTFASGARSGLGLLPLSALMRTNWRAASMAMAEMQLPSSGDPVATAALAKELRRTGDGAAFAALCDLIPETDVTADLPHVQARTLVTRRLDDPLSQQSNAQELATTIPDARLFEIEGRLHAPFEGEHADRFVDAILEFLSPADSAPRAPVLEPAATASTGRP